MKKKILALAMASAMALSLLAGCGSEGAVSCGEKRTIFLKKIVLFFCVQILTKWSKRYRIL